MKVLFMLLLCLCSVLYEVTTIPIVHNQLPADLIYLYYATFLIIADVKKVLHIKLGGRDILDVVHAFIIALFCSFFEQVKSQSAPPLAQLLLAIPLPYTSSDEPLRSPVRDLRGAIQLLSPLTSPCYGDNVLDCTLADGLAIPYSPFSNELAFVLGCALCFVHNIPFRTQVYVCYS